MHWTRRHFIQIWSAMLSVLGLGGLAVVSRKLDGRVYFEDWRAIPHIPMTLHLDVEKPEETTITLTAKYDGKTMELAKLPGAKEVLLQVPYIETTGESYDLCATVTDRQGRRCQAEPLEVISETIHFGM